MDIITILVTIVLNYVIFKLGEHYAYFKIARGLQNLKDLAGTADSGRAVGITEIEKIGEQYYAYIDNNFVGQAASIDELKQLVRQVVEKNPGRYSSMMIKMKE